MRRPTTIMLFLGLLAVAVTGEPMAPVKVTGDASFQQDGANWIITTGSDRTIIHWNDFQVAEGATVHFQQPAVSSAVLNRVLGSQASYINGLLSSNGAVYLINPNGISIGRTGVINVASFIGSTLPVTDKQFLAGRELHFVGTSPAAIENFGKIDAIGGDIYLIALKVANQGTLTARGGSVNLLAAADVLLTQDHEIFVRPTALSAGGIGVDNGGAIEAMVARLAADGNMYALAINNTGVIRASGSDVIAGRVFLRGEGGSVVNDGTVVARTAGADGRTVGGEVQVVGEAVALTANSTTDASGDLGGGTVLVGGGALGADPDVPNARTAVVESGAVVSADALQAGDGGTIVVYSDEATTVAGSLSARGAGGGSGGVVETSGAALDVSGMELACGLGGTWVIDPPLSITPAMAAGISSTLDAGTHVIYGPPAALTSITVEPGANIVKTTPTGAPILWLQTTGNITINANIDVGTGALRLYADGSVMQAPGTTLAGTQLQIKGQGAGPALYGLISPTNDFDTIGVLVYNPQAYVYYLDANDITIGNVGSAHGASVVGGTLRIESVNGDVLANGVLGPGVAWAYTAVGNVAVTESSWNSLTYEIHISNDDPALPKTGIEGFIGASLDGILDNGGNPLGSTATEGSAVRIDFHPLAGDLMGYEWNFRVREAYSAQSPNDFCFIKLEGASPSPPELLVDVESARTSAKQTSGEFSWYTGWAGETRELDHVSQYKVFFGTMDVVDTDHQSELLLRKIIFEGHPIPPSPMGIYERIFDHVEDFPHVRPDPLAGAAGAEMLRPMLDELTAWFNASAQGSLFYDDSTKAVDPRYPYQSVGSIYQIPR